MMSKDVSDDDKRMIADKLLLEVKEKENVSCPRCNSKLLIQRNKDWTRVHAVYCSNCGFGIRYDY